jgi:hypothetical protein
MPQLKTRLKIAAFIVLFFAGCTYVTTNVILENVWLHRTNEDPNLPIPAAVPTGTPLEI